MLRAWMNDNGSTDWVIWCRFVQWQKNALKHRVIGRSPYTALFGTEPKLGLGSTNIPVSYTHLDVYKRQHEEHDTHDVSFKLRE